MLPPSTAALTGRFEMGMQLDFFKSRLPLDTRFLGELRQDLGAQSVLRAQQATVHGFLNCSEWFGVTAGSDRILRFWDYRAPELSYRIVQPGQKAGVAAVDGAGQPLRHASVPRSQVRGHVIGRAVFMDEASSDQPSVDAKSHQDSSGPHSPSLAHADAILALKAIEHPQQMLVTGSRDSVIKVWR